MGLYVCNWPISTQVIERIYLWLMWLSSSNRKYQPFPLLSYFSVVVCLRCLLHHILSRNWDFVLIIIVQFMMSANSPIRYGLQIVFVCLYITPSHCPACRTYLIATIFWVVVICPIIKCLTVLEFSFLLFDLCLFIIIFNCILNYVPIVTFWIFTYHKILLIIFFFIWNYWIIYFLTCLEVFWSVVS